MKQSINDKWIEFYTKFNLIIIPLLPRSKRPFIKEWQKIIQSKKITGNQNFGLLTGRINNITVIDIDRKDNGLKTWRSWIKKYGKIDTPTVKTGNEGYHYYFKYNEKLHNRLNIKINGNRIGIDIKGNGGQVVVPPSIHPNGTKYKWTKSLDNYEIIEVPKWLEDIILKQ